MYHYDVATVLTACGIETHNFHLQKRTALIVATVLTACGIETLFGVGLITREIE